MPSKKSSDKKLSSDAKLLTEKSSTEQFKYVAVMLEDMQSQMRSFGENLDMTRTALNEKIDKVHAELKQDIEMTQMALKAVKNDHDERFNRIEEKLDRVEIKLDAVAEKVDHHDEEIVFLKAAVAK